MAENDSRPDQGGSRPEEGLPCRECGGRTCPVRYTPKLSGLPELVTFECADCGNIETSPWP
jgi:hypothetical protein